ncbi:MAG: PAS domain S-box protein, partial [Desulfobacterales bacterium]|nr:PAS domain S-box protein [Desulfobacterales bacterium]
MSEKPTYEELWQRVQELEQKEYAQSSQIEDSFADTSELLSFFIKHSPIYAFIKEITNKASKVIYASDNYLDMTGIPASQMVGKTMEELFPEQFANKITGDDIDVVKNGKNLKLNEELNGKSYVTYKFPLMQNKRTLLAGYTIDISDLKQAEEGFAQIFNMSLDMICIADINASTLVKVNPAFTRILGYSEDELVQKSFYEFIHPDDIELTQSVVEEKLRQGTNIINFENRCRCKDGGYRWLSWVAHPDSESGKIYAIARDVTDYKKIEKSLETQNTLMRTLLENLQVGVFMIEAPSGKPLLANKRAKELIGRGIMPDADKTNLAEVYQAYQSDTGNIYPEDQLPVVRALMGEHHSIDDMYVVKPNGEKINLEVHGSPVFNDNNEITAGLISFTDITTKRRMEEQFRQAQKMESIGRLAGGVAHDFNNMLSIILGNIELIFDDLDPSNPVTKNLKEVQKAAKRSTNLTHQLLAFARKQTISPEIVDLNKAISGMLRMLRRLIGEDIDLKWLPRTALWPVKIDPSQVDQILANLCVNARDAIKDVG